MRLGNYRFDQQLAMDIGEKIIYALVILLVTWLLAKAAKWAFAKLVDNVSFFQRGTGNGSSLGESLGKIVSLLIWLFGLLAILNVFNLGAVAAPIDSLLKNVVDFIPNLVGAALIFFIGMMVAKIVRDLITTALGAVDFDKFANRGGVDSMTGNTRISSTIGTIVYAIIVVFVSIMALEALNLESISGPASNMLQLIFDAIPRIIGAAILLGLGYLISRFVVDILREVLAGLGVDRAVASSGMVNEGTSASGIIARVAQVAIMLFFAIAATRLLGFPELTAILDQILELGASVVFGAVVIGVGFLLANMLARMIEGTAGTIIRYAAMVLFVFMGLRFMGVGEEIVDMAFGALVIGGAVAASLAFGLGGRDWAGRKLEQLDNTAAGSTPAAKPRKKAAAPKSDKPLPPGA